MWSMPIGSSSVSRIDRHARMPGLAEHGDRLGDGRVHLERLDVGAHHHHVLDAHVAELQDGAQHGALVGGERGARRFVGGYGVFDFRAGRSVRLDAQRAS